MYLVELLVALVIAGLLAAMIGSSLGQTLNISTKSQYALLAPLLAQEVMDRVRSTQFDSLPASGKQYTVQTNFVTGDSSNPQANVVLDRPLLLDTVNLTFHTGGANPVPAYAFHGEVFVQFTDGAIPSGATTPDTKTVVVTVQWPISSPDGAQSLKTYQVTRLISRFGLQRNDQM
jgi:type II secretory pathway pseudopilin PulG